MHLEKRRKEESLGRGPEVNGVAWDINEGMRDEKGEVYVVR